MNFRICVSGCVGVFRTLLGKDISFMSSWPTQRKCEQTTALCQPDHGQPGEK